MQKFIDKVMLKPYTFGLEQWSVCFAYEVILKISLAGLFQTQVLKCSYYNLYLNTFFMNILWTNELKVCWLT